MLEHQKKVLAALSYDKHLFRKELIKSQAWLNANELNHLRIWVRQNFYHKHSDVIEEVLYPEYKYAI